MNKNTWRPLPRWAAVAALLTLGGCAGTYYQPQGLADYTPYDNDYLAYYANSGFYGPAYFGVGAGAARFGGWGGGHDRILVHGHGGGGGRGGHGGGGHGGGRG